MRRDQEALDGFHESTTGVWLQLDDFEDSPIWEDLLPYVKNGDQIARRRIARGLLLLPAVFQLMAPLATEVAPAFKLFRLTFTSASSTTTGLLAIAFAFAL